MKYLSCIISMLMLLSFPGKAQELNATEKQIFEKEASNLIKSYYADLPQTLARGKDSVDVQDRDEEGEDVLSKTTYKQQFIEKYFENNDVYVYNDLEPDNDNPSPRVMTIDDYLDKIKAIYGEKKSEELKLSLKNARLVEVSYNSQAVVKFYLAKIEVQRVLQGSYLGKQSVNNERSIDFYIKTLDKPDSRLREFKIVGIDYESQVINIGNIGVEEAIAQGMKYYNTMDYDKAFQYLIKYQDEKELKKNSNATWALGYMYFWGRGIKRSDEEMVKWLTYSADKNNIYALYYLGENYYYGEYGVEEDEKKAFKLIKESARKGYSEAQYFLGQRFEKGEGIRQSDKAAKRWYRRATEQGHIKAKYALKALENK